MKNRTRTLTVLTVGLLSCGLFCQQAIAVPISGTIGFDGTVTISKNATTTTLTFGTDTATTGPNTGSYAVVPDDTPVTFTNFSYNNTTLAITSPADTPFVVWTFTFAGGTYDFTLNSPLTSGLPALSGTGGAQITFPDPPFTSGIFSLNPDGTSSVTPFHASTVVPGPPSVPDGGSAFALLGIALVGIEALRRKLKAC